MIHLPDLDLDLVCRLALVEPMSAAIKQLRAAIKQLRAALRS